MPYSDRQLAQLSAMGLVAWVERHDWQAASEPDDGKQACELAEQVGTLSTSPASGSDAPAADTDRHVATGKPVASPAGAGAPDSDPRDRGQTQGGADPAATDHPDADPSDLALTDAGSLERDPVSPALPMPMPREPSVLAAWLPSRPLAPFVYRERTLTRVGREDAPLLIVVERGEPTDGLPLVGAAAELFERMLRAIGLTRRDTRQCVLSAEPSPVGADTVGEFAAAPYRAALVLMQELDGELDGSACRFLLGTAAAHPAWCLPHPDLLLLEPRRKAQAWGVLKALRQHLGAAA